MVTLSAHSHSCTCWCSRGCLVCRCKNRRWDENLVNCR